jgi:hypothetical protein
MTKYDNAFYNNMTLSTKKLEAVNMHVKNYFQIESMSLNVVKDKPRRPFQLLRRPERRRRCHILSYTTK